MEFIPKPAIFYLNEKAGEIRVKTSVKRGWALWRKWMEGVPTGTAMLSKFQT